MRRWGIVIKVMDFLKRKHRVGRIQFQGQSIVEFTLLLPLLLMMLSGLIEFGFMLNEYLDLIDTTRETARYLSDRPPFSQGTDYNEDFYTGGISELYTTMQRAGWIDLDPAVDDVIISVFSLTDWSTITRYPDQTDLNPDPRSECGVLNGGSLGWRYFCNKTTNFSDAEIRDRIDNASSIPPNNGLVLVEIFYHYHMRLGLPWITAFVGDTIELHAFSFAPNAYAEP